MFIFDTIHGRRNCDSYYHNEKESFYVLDNITRVDDSKVVAIYERTQMEDELIFSINPPSKEQEFIKRLRLCEQVFRPYVNTTSNLFWTSAESDLLKKYLTLDETNDAIAKLDEETEELKKELFKETK